MNRNRARLRHILVLICRSLAILMLVLAFAKPFFGDNTAERSGPKTVNIFVDNSFSMDSESRDGLKLEIAKSKAAGIVEAYGETDQFRLITQDFSGVQSKKLSKEDFLEELSRVKPGPFSRSLQEIADRMDLNIPEQERLENVNYIISDFQSAATKADQFKGRDRNTKRFFLCPVEKAISGNVSVDSVWFKEPIALAGEQANLMVQVQHHGNEDSGEIPVTLSINGKQKAVSSVILGPGEKKNIPMSYLHATEGWQLGEVSIADAETPFDNTLYFSYEITERARVLQLSEKESNAYLRAVYQNDSLIEYSEMNQSDVQYQGLRSYDLIIIHGWKGIPGGLADGLSKALEEGASIAVVPPGKDADLSSYRVFLQSTGAGWYKTEDTVNTEISSINYGSELYKGVFNEKSRAAENLKLPMVKHHYQIAQAEGKIRDFALVLKGGDPYLAGYDAASGKIFLMASAIEEASGNFHRHGIFVPSFFRMAFQKQLFNEIFLQAGRKEPFVIRGRTLRGDQVPKLYPRESREGIIPPCKFTQGKGVIFPENILLRGGHYRISVPGEDTLGYISVNHQRAESEQRFLSSEELDLFCRKNKSFQVIASTGAAITKKVKEAGGNGNDWRIFLFFSLIFLFFEVVLLKTQKLR